MDGPSAAQAIRASQTASADAVIIGVTALIETSVGDGGAAVMDDILTKPVSRQQLADAIRQTRHAAPANAKVDSGIAPDALSLTAAEAFDELCDMVGRDTGLRLAQATLDDARRAMVAITSRALTDTERADIVHKAVGSAGLMGFLDLSETLSEAETMLRAGRDPAGTDVAETGGSLLQDLRDSYGPLLHDLMPEAQNEQA